MNTHTGLKPYACKYCGQSFANKSNARIHERGVHLKLPTCRPKLCGISTSKVTNNEKDVKHKFQHQAKPVSAATSTVSTIMSDTETIEAPLQIAVQGSVPSGYPLFN